MDWVKIGSALLMLAMIIWLFPRAKDAVKNSPKGNSQDWLSFMIPIGAVILFIIVLISLI